MTTSSVFTGDVNASDLVSALTAKAAQSADKQASVGGRGFDYYLQVKDTTQANDFFQTAQNTPVDRNPSRKERDYQRFSDDDRAVRERPPREMNKPANTATDNTASKVKDQSQRSSNNDNREETDQKIVSAVADALDVPVETVMQWLAQLQMQPADLTDPQAVTTLLQKAFGVNEPAALLTEPAFPAAFDAINKAMEAFQTLTEATNPSETLAQLQDLTVITDATNEMVVVTNGAAALVEVDGADGQADIPTADIAPETVIPTETVSAPAAQQQTADTGGQMTQDGQLGEAVQQDGEWSPAVTGNLSFESAAARVMEATGTRTAAPVDATSVMEQIMSRVRMQSGNQFAELKITLRPENLGDVTLRVMTLNGIVTAQFIAENQRVKEALESNFTQLRDMLQQQGINISELSVSVGQEEGDERMNQFLRAQQSGRRRMQRITNRGMEADDILEDEIDAIPMADPADVLLNSVDFTA